MAAEGAVHQLGPAVFGELAGEEAALAAEFLGLGVHVVHELVDEGDGDLLDLGLGIGDFADEDVAGGVDSAFGVGVEHGRGRVCRAKAQRRKGRKKFRLGDLGGRLWREIGNEEWGAQSRKDAKEEKA